MKLLTAAFSLAALAECSTAAPLAKAEVAPCAEVRVPFVGNVESDTVVIQAVHGQAQYRDGSHWAALRPNMVLTNGVQIRPGADSSIDLLAGDRVSMRLMADHNQKIRAFLVRRGRAMEAAASARSSAGPARPPSAPALGAGGKVRVKSGEIMLTANGKTHLLRAGEYFDANTGAVDGELQSAGALAPILSRSASHEEIVSAPRAVSFDGGLETARRGVRWLGE